MAAAQQIRASISQAGFVWSSSLPAALRFLLSLLSEANSQVPGDINPDAWERIIQLAEAHGIIPQLCSRLRMESFKVPAGAFDNLRAFDALNTKKNLRLMQELMRIAESFSAEKILILPYKGPALSQFLFNDIGMRQAGDLDLLVRVTDVPRAISVLRQLGFTPRLTLTPARQKAYMASGYEYAFDGAAGKNLVELKWRILPRFYAVDFDVDGLFARSKQLRIGNVVFPALCSEDLLLVLCVHAAKHLWAKLGWLCDIKQLLMTQELRWQFLHEQAQALGITRILALNVCFAHRFLGAPLPKEAAPCVAADAAIERLLEKLSPHILRADKCDTQSLTYFRLISEMREHRRDRARFWGRLVATPGPSEWSAVGLPESLSFMYRGIRGYRLWLRGLSSETAVK